MASPVDYCTLFPENWKGVDISPCCMAHDLAYGAGLPKWSADHALATCISIATNDTGLGLAFMVALTILGWPFYARARLTKAGNTKTK